jgi:hypothetical protein
LAELRDLHVPSLEGCEYVELSVTSLKVPDLPRGRIRYLEATYLGAKLIGSLNDLSSLGLLPIGNELLNVAIYQA